MRSTNVLARTAMAGLALLGLSATAAAQGRIKKNVIYGMCCRLVCWTFTILRRRMALASSSSRAAA